MIATSALLISSNNAKVARAAGLTMDTGGIVSALPSRRPLVFVTIMLFAVLALTVAKAMLITMIGADAYGAGLAVMGEGSVVDQAGAMLLGVDAATRAIADLFL